jgi:hypothetical protein
MMNAQIKNKIIILLFLTIYIYGNDTYLSLVTNDDAYFSVAVDINKDGVLDKVISSKPYQGNELYFFENKNGKYELVFKGLNFSEDGGNIISNIKPSNLEDESMNITTMFPDRGHFVVNYLISYKKDTWYLSKILYEVGYPFDFDERVDICSIKKNIKLYDIVHDNIDIYSLPEEKDRDKQCIIEYNIKSSLNDFIERIKNSTKDKYQTTQRYMSLLKKYPLSKENLTQYNDIAYYLEQSKAYKESIYLLEKIIEKYPERTVAYLNIADAYWGDNDKDKAIENYKIYISQMKENSKENKIPQKVFERINTKDIKKDTISKEIQIEKQYLFDNPNKESKTKMYLLKNDKVEILEEKDDWLYILYKGKKDIKAWIPKSAIEETQIQQEIKPVSKLNQNTKIQS